MPKPIGKILEADLFELAVEELGISGKYVEASRLIMVDGKNKMKVRQKMRLMFDRLQRTAERIEFTARRIKAEQQQACN